MSETIISFIVKVPVLSVLMALVAPSVSTSVRFLTTAFASASCLAPSDSSPETNAGMPVGIAEIAMAVPSSSRSVASRPRASPTATMKATAPHAMSPSTLVSCPSSCWSGDRVRLTVVSIVAIWPIWVPIPVAVTTTEAVPRVTAVFWNTMLDRSPIATSLPPSAAGPFGTGALSPVSAGSCVSRVAAWTMRPSAGTMSPASSWTMSPATTPVAGTSASVPSRTTLACGTCRLESASMLARAVSSCRVPSTRLSRMSSATSTPVETSPIAKLTTVTATSMMFMGSRSWASTISRTDGGFSPAISLGPSRASRASASARVRPAVASEPRAATTSAASRAYSGMPAPSAAGPAVAGASAGRGGAEGSLIDPLPLLLERLLDVAPAHDERVQDEDVDRHRDERPERVLARPHEAELDDEVQAGNHDCEPARPAALSEQREARERDHDAPDQRDPAPGLDVEDDDLLRRERVVAPADDRDQALDRLQHADDDHHQRGEDDPSAPEGPGRHLPHLPVRPPRPTPGLARLVAVEPACPARAHRPMPRPYRAAQTPGGGATRSGLGSIDARRTRERA